MKLIGISGAHGTGKTSVLEELQKQAHPEIYIDDFKVSRTVLAELGMTLEEATATPERTKSYQTRVLTKKILRDGHSLPVAALQSPGVKSAFVDRTPADIYAYTSLWVEKNNIEPEWFEKFEQVCIDAIRLYDLVIVLPIGKFQFVDDGIRAKEETQRAIAEYIDDFVQKHCVNYVIIDDVSVADRAAKFVQLGKQ